MMNLLVGRKRTPPKGRCSPGIEELADEPAGAGDGGKGWIADEDSGYASFGGAFHALVEAHGVVLCGGGLDEVTGDEASDEADGSGD